MDTLNCNLQNILISVRPDQNRTLEMIKYEGKLEKNMKIPKTEIIRVALDSFFEMSVDEILELISKRDTRLNQ